jgi:hypothetical protein
MQLAGNSPITISNISLQNKVLYSYKYLKEHLLQLYLMVLANDGTCTLWNTVWKSEGMDCWCTQQLGNDRD